MSLVRLNVSFWIKLFSKNSHYEWDMKFKASSDLICTLIQSVRKWKAFSYLKFRPNLSLLLNLALGLNHKINPCISQKLGLFFSNGTALAKSANIKIKLK